MVVKLAGDLQHLWSLMRYLCWGVPDGLVALPRLGPEAVGNLLRNVLDQGPAVDVQVGVEEALLHALLDDLPDRGLGQGLEVDFSRDLLGYVLSLDEHGLHLHLDGAVVRDLVDMVGHYGVGDGDVPGPQLVQLVAIPVGLGPLPEGGGEAGQRKEGVHLVKLAV